MNSYEDPALSYECDREAELVSLRARLVEAADWIAAAHQTDCSIFWRNSTECNCGRDALYRRITADSAPAALDLERVDIHRCPACGALPRPSLMGGTVCPNGHGNVQQPMPTGSADEVTP